MKYNENFIAVYSRKSKFTGKGESIENQTELCKRYIGINYGKEFSDKILIYEDEGFSGGNTNRPSFKRMMLDAKEHKFKAIVVYRLDRISRNISDFSALIDVLSKLNIDFVSIKEQFDTATPMGRAMMYISSVFSQLERETIAERIRDNMLELAKSGRWLGGITPTGYASQAFKTATADGKSKKSYMLKIIPEQALTVKTIFELFLKLNSLTLTSSALAERKIKSKNGKYFTPYTIKSILKNPVYAVADEDVYRYFQSVNAAVYSQKEKFDGEHGIMAYNRTYQEKGKAAVPLPPCEWIISVGQHKGLITGRNWVEVQERLDKNRSKTCRKSRKNSALLTGIIYCSCSGKMYPKLSKRITENSENSFSYVCKNKQKSKGSICSKNNICGNTFDAIVIDHIKKLDESKNMLYKNLYKYCKLNEKSETDINWQKSNFLKKKAENEKMINGLVDSLCDIENIAVKNKVTERIANLTKEIERIDNKIKELEFTENKNMYDKEIKMLSQTLLSPKTIIDNMTLNEKRNAVQALIEKIVWDGETAHIFFYGAM